MQGRIIVVKAARDAEAGVWYVEDGDLPGLNLEAETLEELVEKLPGAILDLLETGDDDYDGTQELPVELIAHARTKVRLSSAA
jgi:predicted RNase H-like HicB family nuclease